MNRFACIVTAILAYSSIMIWKNQPWPIFSALTERRRLLLKILQYMALSILSCLVNTVRLLGPLQEKKTPSKMFPPHASQLGWNSWDCTHPSTTAREIYTNKFYSIILSFTVGRLKLKLQIPPFFRKTCKICSESNPLQIPFFTLYLLLYLHQISELDLLGDIAMGKKVLVLSIPYQFTRGDQKEGQTAISFFGPWCYTLDVYCMLIIFINIQAIWF